MKQKTFAAAIHRDDILRGAEDLGVELKEHRQTVIDAMLGISDSLGLEPRDGSPMSATE